MRIIFFSLLLVFISLSVQAQNDFRKGYVITHENDTLRGLINYREGYRNFLICEFKTTLDAQSVRYHASEIAGYRFEDDKLIVSRKLHLIESPDTWFFVEVLVDGSLTLYQYRDRFFVGRSDSVDHELTNEERDIVVNGKKMRQESGKFRGILLYLMQDCSSVKSAIEKLRLNQRELTQLFERYNQCVGQVISYSSQKPWFKVVPGITAGVSSSSFSYDNSGPMPGEFSNSNTFTAGLDAEFNSPRIHEYVSFYAGIFYLHNQFTAYHENVLHNGITYHDITVAYSQIKVPMTIRYTFSSRGLVPFFNIGIVPALLDVSDNTWRAESLRNNTVYTEEEEPFNFARRNVGLTGGVGIKQLIGKKLRVRAEFRYEVFRKIYESPILDKGRIENYQLLFSISL